MTGLFSLEQQTIGSTPLEARSIETYSTMAFHTRVRVHFYNYQGQAVFDVIDCCSAVVFMKSKRTFLVELSDITN